MGRSVQADYLKLWLKRRSFAGLMDLYEENYRLLRRLAPDLPDMAQCVSSTVAGSQDLHLEVLERCKFTTTLAMTYYFRQADGVELADPDLRVRVYHDAGQAEVLTCVYNRWSALGRDWAAQAPVLDNKWDRNRFLHKWLQYLLAQGHGFAVAAPCPAEQGTGAALIETS